LLAAIPPLKVPDVLVKEPLGNTPGLSEVEVIGATVVVTTPAERQVRDKVAPEGEALTGDPAPFRTAARALAMAPGEALTG